MVATAKRKRRPLTPRRQELAAAYLPLARRLARPYKQLRPEAREDYESAACYALVEAAESFNRRLGVKFATFASYRITGALREVQRKRTPLGYRDDPESAPGIFSTAPSPDAPGWFGYGGIAPEWIDLVENPEFIVGAEPDPPVGFDLDEED